MTRLPVSTITITATWILASNLTSLAIIGSCSHDPARNLIVVTRWRSIG